MSSKWPSRKLDKWWLRYWEDPTLNSVQASFLQHSTDEKQVLDNLSHVCGALVRVYIRNPTWSRERFIRQLENLVIFARTRFSQPDDGFGARNEADDEDSAACVLRMHAAQLAVAVLWRRIKEKQPNESQLQATENADTLLRIVARDTYWKGDRPEALQRILRSICQEVSDDPTERAAMFNEVGNVLDIFQPITREGNLGVARLG